MIWQNLCIHLCIVSAAVQKFASPILFLMEKSKIIYMFLQFIYEK